METYDHMPNRPQMMTGKDKDFTFKHVYPPEPTQKKVYTEKNVY